jgi:hypothetical protein
MASPRALRPLDDIFYGFVNRRKSRSHFLEDGVFRIEGGVAIPPWSEGDHRFALW